MHEKSHHSYYKRMVAQIIMNLNDFKDLSAYQDRLFLFVGYDIYG